MFILPMQSKQPTTQNDKKQAVLDGFQLFYEELPSADNLNKSAAENSSSQRIRRRSRR